MEQLERRELLDTGLGSTVGLTAAASSRLVTALYNDLLHRAPQPSELAGWQSALNAGHSLVDLARAFISSQEYQTDFITSSYATVLKRQAQPKEVNGWLQATEAGLNEERLTAQFLSSDEYYYEHGRTAEGWLTGLYWDLFQRRPDAAAFFLWRDDLQNGVSRQTVALGFVTSQEANTRLVTAGYQQFLGRDPEWTGKTGWVAALNGSMPQSRLTAGITGSLEYFLMHTGAAAGQQAGAMGITSSPRFDFGSAQSPVAQGHLGVSLLTYNQQRGYGWESLSGLVVQDRGGTSGLDGTFRVELPDGAYTVAPTLGDTTAAHADITIWAQGVQEVTGLSTAAGQFIRPTFNVQVTSGQLELRLAADGAGNTFVIDNLEIVPTTAPVVSAGPGSATNQGAVVPPTGASKAGIAPSSTVSNAGNGNASFSTPTSTQASSNTSPAPGTSPVTSTVSPTVQPSTNNHKLTPTVTINGAPATSLVNVPVALTSTVNDPNPGATNVGFTYAWSVTNNGRAFASGTTSNFSFTPNAAGTYVVALAVTDKNGITGTTLQNINVTVPNLVVSVGADITSSEGAAVRFTGAVTGGTGPYTYAWDFGDGDKASGGLTPTYTYANSGTYTVTLTATDALNHSGQSTLHVTVQDVPPTVAINGAPASSPEGSAISLTSTSTSPSPVDTAAGFGYTWSVTKDGSAFTSATTPNLTFTPVEHGSYVVTLVATAKDNATGTATQTITVTDVAPLVSINGAPTSGTEGTAVALTSTVTSTSSADTAAGFSYAWSVTKNGAGFAAATTPNFNFTPDAAGTYVVTLAATDKDNATGTDTKTFTVGVSNPVVSAGKDMAAPEGTPVQFAGTVTGGTGPYTYAWDFGNGDKASGSLTPTYTYANSGTFTVTLTVTDSQNHTGQSTLHASVQDMPPSAAINGARASSPEGTPIALTSTVSSPSSVDMAGGFGYAWSVTKDGSAFTSATTPNLSFTPVEHGTYVVTLVATAKDNATGTATQTITVTDVAPLVSINSAPTSGTEGSAIALTNKVYSPSSADTTAGFGYAWSVTKNGTAFASATTANFSFTPDSDATYAVTLTVTDKDGATATDSKSITVPDAGPTANANGPYTGIVGSAIAFKATATDPSPVDTTAGFTYAWNFGDNSTSVVAASSHAYAAAGTYTVTLTATDKDGTSNTVTTTATVTATTTQPPGNFITTEYDKIPNFGANPNIVSANSGSWSSTSTWSLGRVPAAGDVVSINANTTVTYDVVSDAAINTVIVQAGGHLIFRTDVNTRLTVINLLVLQGGELQIGSAANPVAANVKAEVVIPDVPLDTVNDPAQYGHGLIGLGTVTMYGAAKPATYINLATEPKAGATTLTLAQPATGWQVGDRLILPDTRQLLASERFANYTPEWEQLKIQSISPDGTVLTLTSPLQYDHLGARDGNGVLDFLPQVGDLSRNIMIHSQNAAGTRGYVMFTGRANVDIRYVLFGGLGRTTQDADNNTTFDANGNVTHVGTNETDRNPVIFSHLMGPTTTPADGYQFTFLGNSVFCTMTPADERWGITLNDADYGLISHNVVYNWAGAGIAAENSDDSFNMFQSNFVVGIRGNASPRDITGLYGAGFWLTSFNNYVVDNVAADCIGTYLGIVAGAGFDLNTQPADTQNTKVPLFPGADLQITGQYQLVNMQLTPILEFSGNEAYGAMATGLTIWNLGTNGYAAENIGTSVIKKFTAWHTHDEAFFSYNIQNVTFDGFVVRGDPRCLPNPADHGLAWAASDYWSGNVTIENSDIQGMGGGIGYDTNTPGVFTIQNSYLRNYGTDVSIQTLASPGTGAAIPPRKTVINNVKFDPWQGAPSFVSISMDYNGTNGYSNLIQSDQVFVYNYNQVQGDNFQVYYVEQAPTFIVPQTVMNTVLNKPSILGSPEAGLTNQQNWSKYGIAIAGAVAPTTQTRTGIHGYVAPF